MAKWQNELVYAALTISFSHKWLFCCPVMDCWPVQDVPRPLTQTRNKQVKKMGGKIQNAPPAMMATKVASSAWIILELESFTATGFDSVLLRSARCNFRVFEWSKSSNPLPAQLFGLYLAEFPSEVDIGRLQAFDWPDRDVSACSNTNVVQMSEQQQSNRKVSYKSAEG